MKPSGTLRRLVVILLLAVVYMIAGKLGLRLASVNPSATAVWPATGIALAALLLLGSKAWPGVFLGAFLVNLTTAGTAATSLAIATGNTLEALAGWYLLNRFAHGSKAFDRAQDVFRFAVLAGVGSTTISSTIGVTSLCLSGHADWADFGRIWATWWLGDLAGALVVTPVIVLWHRDFQLRWNLAQFIEAVVLLTGLVLTTQVVFGGLSSPHMRNYPLEFLCIPFLIWAAFSFGQREAATAVFLISGNAIRGTVAGFGPFARGSANESLVLLQIFIGVSAVMSLALAALVYERKGVEQELQRLAATDPMTGLANYRRFMEILGEEFNRSQRTQSPFVVLLLDMDGMKRINDHHGHLVGNRALGRLADILRSYCRNIDTAARFGGDEFAMILLETEKAEAQQVVRRVFERLSRDEEIPALTVSVGISAYPSDGETVDKLLEVADRALYQMKRNGGGAVPQESVT